MRESPSVKLNTNLKTVQLPSLICKRRNGEKNKTKNYQNTNTIKNKTTHKSVPATFDMERRKNKNVDPTHIPTTHSKTEKYTNRFKTKKSGFILKSWLMSMHVTFTILSRHILKRQLSKLS